MGKWVDKEGLQYVIDWFKNSIAGIYRYSGTVATVEDLNNIVNPKNGDTYNVESNGMNYAWNEEEERWDELGANIGSLPHKLTFGANNEFVYDGSSEVNVPVYTGNVNIE